MVPIDAPQSASAGSSHHLTTDQRIHRLQIGISVEEPMQRVEQRGTERRLPWLSTLAGPGQRRKLPQVVQSQSGDLRNTQPRKTEANHELVPQTHQGSVLASADELPERLLVGEPPARVASLDLAVGAAV